MSTLHEQILAAVDTQQNQKNLKLKVLKPQQHVLVVH